MTSNRYISCLSSYLSLDLAQYGAWWIGRLFVLSSSIRCCIALFELRCSSNMHSIFVSMLINLSHYVDNSSSRVRYSGQSGFENSPECFTAIWRSTCSLQRWDRSLRTALIVEPELNLSHCVDMEYSFVKYVQLIISRMDDVCCSLQRMGDSHELPQAPGLAFMFTTYTMNGFPGKMSNRPHEVMKHRLSTTLPWVSVVLTLAPWLLTYTAACMYACIIAWRATRHKLSSSLDVSACGRVFTLNSVLSEFIELIAVFVEMTATGFKFQGWLCIL